MYDMKVITFTENLQAKSSNFSWNLHNQGLNGHENFAVLINKN